MKLEFNTIKGNEFDIMDSLFLSSVGDKEFTNVALSFYNKDLEYGISYYPDSNSIVFQTDNYDEEYWNEDRLNIIKEDLEKYIDRNKDGFEELPINVEGIVNYILNEMDNYCYYLDDKHKDFAIKLREILA